MGLHLLPYGIKNKELQRIGFKKARVNSSLPGTSLASMESLSLPLMQEVVLSADIKCEECQKRIAYIMSRLKGEEGNTHVYIYWCSEVIQ
ncbi:uncharacterized protein LOC123217375 isoform X2 [Mangifera indica]|uniref:uncharacterized protein LOC123217375 isoform X2 n=1 Tax=Mangifera indica TaxID=29780 RepID=UPI001CFC042F|nr:uncharacterized protein LOC123217375 isoform X2 [Mangifera indica]